ncbi:MAG: transposase [Candidatus Omnitrophica bacterium]|nr:transposase [Candidatus Omnitrophota bacterium]
MARPRQTSATGWYHVLGRGTNRQTLFLEDADCKRFLEILDDHRKLKSIQIAHYCLMPNHVHILLHSELRKNLSKCLQGINLSYSWWYRRRYDFCGHVWQGRFKSLPIENEGYLLECGRYIERNPVNARMVNKPEDYPWSSYRFYVSGDENPLVTPDPAYLSCGKDRLECRRRYREYAENSRPYELPEAERLAPIFQG